jgi:tape measure domain-containing protein
MSGNIDDMKFSLDVDLKDSLAGLREVVNHLDTFKAQLTAVRPTFDMLNAATTRLASTTAFVGTPADILNVKLGSALNTMERLNSQADRFETYLYQSAQMTPELMEHWNRINRGVTSSAGQMRVFAEQARQAAQATQTIVVDTATQRIQPPKQKSGFDMIKMAAAATAMRAVTVASTGIQKTAVSLRSMSQSTAMAVTQMTRFRMSMLAADVDPRLNVVKTGIDAVGAAAAGGVLKLKGIADAILSDLKGSGQAAVGALSGMNQALDQTTFTAAKHLTKLQQMDKAMGLLSTVFPFAAKAVDRFRQPLQSGLKHAEQFASGLDVVNAKVGQTAADMRGNLYLLTGEWKQLAGTAGNANIISGGMQSLAGSADVFARSQYYALLPLRMVKRELEGAQRIVKVATYGWHYISMPVHHFALKIGHARAELRDLSARLPTVNYSLWKVSGASKAVGVMMGVMKTSIANATKSMRSDLGSRAGGLMESVRGKTKQLSTSFSELRAKVQTGLVNPLVARLQVLQEKTQPVIARMKEVGEALKTNVSYAVRLGDVMIRRYTRNLELAARAHHVFSKGAYAAGTAVRIAAGYFRPIGSVLGALFRPARAASTALDGTVIPARKAGFALRGVTRAADGTFRSLGYVASGAKAASAPLGGMLSRVPGMASAANLALTGLGVAMVGMSASTAMATEKNEAVFGVMLKSADQGRAVVASLQNAEAVGLFDNEEVLNSGRLLFKAGVSAQDLAGKTDQLATIAAATSTELGDLTRIYQQGANSGSFGQDKINQLAERGIDIYHALEAATGKSGGALKDMISGGKIGITEMDAALAHLTEGNGIYAGSLETLGNTTSGMLATAKNNVMQALGNIGRIGLEMFKPMLERVVAFTELMKTSIGTVTPIFLQVSAMIRGIFTGLWAVVSGVFGGLFSGASMTFSGILSVIMEWVTKFRFFFENLWPITQFAFNMIGLGAFTMFNDIAYWLTDTMPAYASWFGENFVNIFRDVFNATVTIFSNLGTNIKNAMIAIWNFIKSGGTADLELTWTPLLDGFQSTVSELPDVPARAMTELEKAMTSRTEALGTQLANSYEQMQAEAQAALTVEAPAMPEIDPNLKSGGTGGGEDVAGGGSQRTSFLVGAMEKGSQEALNAIAAAGGKDKIQNQQLQQQKQMNGHLAKIANKPDPMVMGAV